MPTDSAQPRILPRALIEAIDRYVERELDDAAKFENRQPLDESGIWSLHTLAAKVYAVGWGDGEAAEGERSRNARARERERSQRIERHAREVMAALEEYGEGIVGHLLDDDDNSGERLRRALGMS